MSVCPFGLSKLWFWGYLCLYVIMYWILFWILLFGRRRGTHEKMFWGTPPPPQTNLVVPPPKKIIWSGMKKIKVVVKCWENWSNVVFVSLPKEMGKKKSCLSKMNETKLFQITRNSDKIVWKWVLDFWHPPKKMK